MSNTKKTREQLIQELIRCYVPGHGPDFTVMTDAELEKMLSQIKLAFKIAFDEKIENDDEEDY